MTWLDVVVCLAATLFLLLIRISQRRRLPYPPGPKGLPFIGNVFNAPQSKQWLTYAKWSQEYNSSLIHLNVMGKHICVVNDYEAAQELFVKRSDIYSARPHLPMIQDAINMKWNFGFTRDMEQWKLCRREFELRFRQVTSRAFRYAERKKTVELLESLLVKPEGFSKHLHYMTGSLIVNISYGIHVRGENDMYMKIAKNANTGLIKSTDKNIIDILPWVRHIPSWIPGMKWKKQVDTWANWSIDMRDIPFSFVVKQLENGTATPCLTTDLLETFEDPQCIDLAWKHALIKSVAGTAYSAGTDTTAAGLTTFILTMMLFPDIQQKAQQEIDQVIGGRRLPEFSDQDQLPYVTALIREILRWGVIVPLAIPHAAMKDDVFNGYFIPKGSIVFGNSWAILHDPSVYPEPEKFKPERFLAYDGTLEPNVVKHLDAAFGYGKRICPGRFMAMDSLFITIACLLTTFNFSRPEGENIKPAVDLYKSGLVSHPLPFKCTIKPRSEEAIALIRSAIVALDE